MDKLDRLGWAAGVAFQVCGLRIGVRITDPSLLDSVGSRSSRLDRLGIGRG